MKKPPRFPKLLSIGVVITATSLALAPRPSFAAPKFVQRYKNERPWTFLIVGTRFTSWAKLKNAADSVQQNLAAEAQLGLNWAIFQPYVFFGKGGLLASSTTYGAGARITVYDLVLREESEGADIVVPPPDGQHSYYKVGGKETKATENQKNESKTNESDPSNKDKGKDKSKDSGTKDSPRKFEIVRVRFNMVVDYVSLGPVPPTSINEFSGRQSVLRFGPGIQLTFGKNRRYFLDGSMQVFKMQLTPVTSNWNVAPLLGFGVKLL